MSTMKRLDKRGECPKCRMFTYIYKDTHCATLTHKGFAYDHEAIEVTCACCGHVRAFHPMDYDGTLEAEETVTVCKPLDELGYCPRCHTRNTTDTQRRTGELDCVCNECGLIYIEIPSEL